MRIYHSMYMHITFSTKDVQPLIGEEWKLLLSEYFALRIRKEKELPLAVCAMADHIHILVKYGPYCVPEKFINGLKESSAKFINDYKFCEVEFEWEEDYSAFSFGLADVESMFKFMERQRVYHLNKSYQEEMRDIIEQIEAPYDEEELDRWRNN